MDRSTYIDEIKLAITGGVLDLEIDDITIDKILDSCLREIQRYIDTTVFETIPFSACIDLNPRKINTVVKVYRTQGFTSTDKDISDPIYASQWALLSTGGNLLSTDYVYNYAAWNTTMQIRNTLATDLSFIYDANTNKLYITVSTGIPDRVTIEYIPRYEDVSDVKSDFWIDVLTRLAIAKTKIALGRIRTRYTQSNALWTQDGETILEEGNTELNSLREYLRANTNLSYPID